MSITTPIRVLKCGNPNAGTSGDFAISFPKVPSFSNTANDVKKTAVRGSTHMGFDEIITAGSVRSL
jgi:hypothetical protein